MINVDEDVLAPEVLGDLIARHQFPASLHQQDQQIHGSFLQAQQPIPSLQLIAQLVKREFAELELSCH